MNRSHWIAYGCIIFAALGLGLAFTLGGQEAIAPGVVILGIIWLVALQRDWNVVQTIATVIFAVGTAYATWKGSLPGLMLLVIVAQLSAWDLLSMQARFKRVKPEAVEPGLERKHLIRLAEVDGIGLLLGSLGLLFKINLSIGLEILLSLLAVFALSQLVRHLRRSAG